MNLRYYICALVFAALLAACGDKPTSSEPNEHAAEARHEDGEHLPSRHAVPSREPEAWAGSQEGRSLRNPMPR